jgi:hypothetical protein
MKIRYKLQISGGANKIGAILMLRACSNLGLKEAKEIVDRGPVDEEGESGDPPFERSDFRSLKHFFSSVHRAIEMIERGYSGTYYLNASVELENGLVMVVLDSAEKPSRHTCDHCRDGDCPTTAEAKLPRCACGQQLTLLGQEVCATCQDTLLLQTTEKNICVHTEHCCENCGCKYGDEDCPVVLKLKKQSHDCETSCRW